MIFAFDTAPAGVFVFSRPRRHPRLVARWRRAADGRLECRWHRLPAMTIHKVPTRQERDAWRMAPLGELPPGQLTPLNRIWMVVLRGYLVVAGGLVLVRIVQLATGNP